MLATRDANGQFIPVGRKTTQTVRSAANTTLTATTIPEGAAEVVVWATAAGAATAADWKFGGVVPGTGAGTAAVIPAAMGPVRLGCAGAGSIYTAANSGTADIYLMFIYLPDDDL
jgi:hypothetical protein